MKIKIRRKHLLIEFSGYGRFTLVLHKASGEAAALIGCMHKQPSLVPRPHSRGEGLVTSG